MPRKTSNATTARQTAPRTKSPPPKGSVALVEYAVDQLTTAAGRLANDEGKPGGLVLFPEKLRPIVIGDLHANRKNLSYILAHGDNAKDLESGKAACIFIGDAFHDDRTGHMKNMESSIDLLDDILDLFVRYPGKVYYIRGNHDTFDERLRKSGILQGLELKHAIFRLRGADYVGAVGRLFDAMPYAVIGERYVIVHAGPPRGGIVREELVNIEKYPEKLHQLIWTRVNEFHGGNPSLKEYGERDIRLALELLDMPADAHFIVGHNPIWGDGNKTGVWIDVVGIKNHHILYSGYGSVAPYITFIEGEFAVRHALPVAQEEYRYV